jgi:2'-5' RNA ligase
MLHQGKIRSEAALVVLVPEADALVVSFRQRYDRSASEGMLAHITINYPFQPNQSNRELLVEELSDLFSGYPCVRFKLTKLCQFPDTLYLAIEPERPFMDMIQAIAGRYPESPPYGRAFDPVVPHVTVAEETRGVDFRDIAKEFALASKGKLPITAIASEIWLMEYEDHVWSKIIAFGLAKQSNKSSRP